MVNRLLVFFWLLVPLSALAEETFLGRSAEQWGQQFSSSEGQARVHAAWAMAEMAGRASDGHALSELDGLLKDSDPTVRYWGVMGLQWYGRSVAKNSAAKNDAARSAAFIERLKPLLSDKSAAPRIAATESLGLLGAADLALPVIAAALDDPQDSVRIQAVAALEKLGPAARPAIGTLQKATADSSEYVKRISERALASLGVETGARPLNAKGKKAKAKAKSQS